LKSPPFAAYAMTLPLPRLSTLVLLACTLAAGAAHAQLSLRGDYAAARGITEVSALYARQTKTSVVVTPFSTNAGIDGVISGAVDVATAARSPVPNRPAERDLVFWPVAWDAVVFIVHPSNPVQDLTLAQVRDIYQGKLTSWDQVGGRAAPIDLYSVMGPYDGLEASMRLMLFGNPGYNAQISRLFLNQHQIEVGVQMDPDSIGMTTLAGLDKQAVRALRIEGVAADKDTVADGRYLLTVPLYLVYRADNPKAAEITRFAEFLRTPAAEAVIVGKRLVPHREDDNFRAMHAARLSTLWERIGGRPVPPDQLKFQPAIGAVRTAAEATAVGGALRAAGSTDPAAVAPAMPVAAGGAAATAPASTTPPAAATPAGAAPRAPAAPASTAPTGTTPAAAPARPSGTSAAPAAGSTPRAATAPASTTPPSASARPASAPVPATPAAARPANARPGTTAAPTAAPATTAPAAPAPASSDADDDDGADPGAAAAATDSSRLSAHTC
jgi:phosphate transport system substrate-binding protein